MRKKIKMGKAWRRIFAMMLAMAVLSTAVPVDVRGDNQEEEENIMALSENDLMEVNGAFDDGTEDALWDEGVWEGDHTDIADMTANANDMGAIEMPEVATNATADEGANKPMPIAGQMDLLDPSTTVVTDNIIFSATWIDENGQKHTEWIEWKDNPDGIGVEFPSNAEIHMEFHFVLKDQNSVDSSTRYRYYIPDGLSVDLDELDKEIILEDSYGNVVGKAYVEDGYIDFVFDGLDDLENIGEIGFEVHFEGSLSGEGIDDDGNLDLHFPTSKGRWDIDATVTEPVEGDKTVSQGKWGREVVEGGKRYIEWTVSLKPNYDGPIDGVIEDWLPAGLAWDGGSIQVSNAKGGNTTLDPSHVSYDPRTGKMTINIYESDGIERDNEWNSTISFTFRTELDDDTFDGKITDNGIQFKNEANYIPNDPEIDTKDKAESTVTVKPDVLKKGNQGMNGDVITWTVTINAEELNIGGTTYTDTFGDWADGNFSVADVIDCTPASIKDYIKPNPDGKGFTITFLEGFSETVTLTYKTTVKEGYEEKSYTNRGELGSPDDPNFDVNVSDTVVGKDWISKKGIGYNPVTQVISWDITVNAGDDVLLKEVNILEDFTEIMSHWNAPDLSPQAFEFIRAYLEDGTELTEGSGNNSYTLDSGNNQVTFHFDQVTGTFIIHVELKLTDAWLNWEKPYEDEGWWNFHNHTELDATNGDKNVHDEADANYSPGQIKETNLIDKEGRSMGDGTIQWTIKLYNYDVAIKDLTVTDIIPSGQEYVQGSLYVKPSNYTSLPNFYPEEHGLNVWNDNILEYKIYENGKFVGGFEEFWVTDTSGYQPHIEIVFLTKVAKENTEEGPYKNDASVDVTYANGSKNTDEASATVTDPAGGILKKEGVAQGSSIKWTVTVNEGHYDMGSVKPTLKDQLADCFSYDSGTVYRVDKNGNKTEIKQGAPGPEGGNCYVTVVNNELQVQLPAIGTDTIIFEFYTKITVSQQELEQKYLPLVNEVEFTGAGSDRNAKSGELRDVHVSAVGGSSSINEGMRIVKIDEQNGGVIFLPGAVFQLYLDDIKLGEIITGEDGTGLFNMNLEQFEGLTLKLVESKAPDGYTKEQAGYPTGDGFELRADGFYITITKEMLQSRLLEIQVTNDTEEEIVRTGEISLQKIDAEDETHVLENARFGLYTDSACTQPATDAKFTNRDGVITFSELQPGKTYYLKELQSPEGFVLPANLVISVKITQNPDDTISYEYHYVSGGNDPVVIDRSGRIVIENTKPKGEFRITKVNADGVGLNGAVFGLYEDAACTVRVTTGTTVSGLLTFDGLEYGKTYYYKELVAPDGYVLDETVHSFTIGKATDRENGKYEEVTIVNKEEKGNLVIYKEDENGNGLADVEFALFYYTENNELRSYPEGGPQLTVKTTKVGNIARAVFTGLPFGRYRVIEVGGPDGYDLSVERDVTIDSLDGTNVYITNELVEADIAIVKRSLIDNEIGDLMPGVTFNLVDASTRTTVATGVTNGEGKLTFTGVPYGNYHIVETNVPAGYQLQDNEGCSYPNCVADVKEEDFYDAVDNSPQSSISVPTIFNKKEDGKILILKTGSHTGDTSDYGLSGAKFNLLDEDRNIVKSGVSGSVSQEQWADLQEKFGDLFGDISIPNYQDGLLYFEGLEYGTYYLQETSPAPGYTGDLHEWRITVDSDGVVVTYDGIRDIWDNINQWENVNADNQLIIINRERTAPFISAKLQKVYDKDGFDTTTNDQGALAGAVFGFYKKGPNPEDDWVLYDYWTSDNSGIVYFQRIEVNGDEIGTQYAIKELRAPAGYRLIYDDWIILGEMMEQGADLNLKNNINRYGDGELDEQGNVIESSFAKPEDYRWVEAINEEAPTGYTVLNQVIYGSAQITKTDLRTGRGLGGATFELFYDEACQHSVNNRKAGETNREEYELLDAMLGEDFKNPITTASTGIAVFNGLPQGTYYVKEAKAPAGYLNAGEVKRIEVVVTGDATVDTARMPKVTFTDQQISVQISKRDFADGEELPGAVFNLYKPGTGGEMGTNEIIWTMSGGATKTIPADKLEVGVEYVLREMSAPAGYTYMPDIKFEITKEGTIKIISPVDNSAGADQVETRDGGRTLIVMDKPVTLTIHKLAGDTGRQLPGATMALYKVETNGTEVMVGRPFTTTGQAYTLPIGLLEVPKPLILTSGTEKDSITYILREINAPAGYDIADEIEFKVYSDGSIVCETSGVVDDMGDGDALTWGITMTDQPQRSFYFQKVDSKTGEVLEGAEFQLVEVVKSDTSLTGWEEKIGASAFVAKTWKSGVTPYKIEASSSEDNATTMLIEGHYYALEEIKAPDGYLRPITSVIYFTVVNQNGQLRMELLNGSANNLNRDGNTIIMRDAEISLFIRKEDAFGMPLEGAQLVICEYDEVNEVVGDRVSNPFNSRDIEKMDFIAEHPEANLLPGREHVYALVEITHPDNYRDADPIPFYIAQSGVVVRLDGQEVFDNTVVMLDESKGVGIAKRDIADHNYLAGCTLEISSLDDEFFRVNPATWTSGENDQTWTFDMGVFYPGKTYILSELEAPDGYAYTDPIYFTIGSDNQVYVDGVPQPNNVVYIEDGKIRLAVSKQDKYTGEEVPGALLGLYRLEEDGSETQMVDPWRTGTGALSLNTASMTTTGEGYVEYILRELEAPEGYYKADDIHFALDRDGKVYMVTETVSGGPKTYTPYNGTTLIMREEPKFSVRKMDTDGNYVTGATLQITAKDDADFETITWDTTAEPKFFDLDSGENPFKEGVTYVLKELKAPNGYKVAESIEFTIKAGKLIVNGEQVDNMRVVMLDYKIDEPAKDGATNTPGQSNDPGKAPKTGDDTPLAMLILLCITGLLGAISSFVKYIIWKRKHRVYD